MTSATQRGQHTHARPAAPAAAAPEQRHVSGPADPLLVVAILLFVAVALERPLAGAQVVPLKLDAPGGREPVLEHLRPELVLPSQLLEAEELLGLHAVLEDDDRGEDLRARRGRIGAGLTRGRARPVCPGYVLVAFGA